MIRRNQILEKISTETKLLPKHILRNIFIGQTYPQKEKQKISKQSKLTHIHFEQLKNGYLEKP